MRGIWKWFWTELICSNFIIVRLLLKQMLAQHIPLRLYMAILSLAASICLHRTSLGVLRYHSWTTCGVSFPLLKFCTKWNTVLHAGALSLKNAGNWWSISEGVNATFPLELCGSSLPCLPFMTLVHTLWPLELVSMQQFFIGMQNYGHLVVEWCTKITLSNDNLHHLTACYLLKQQVMSKSLLNTLHTWYVLRFYPHAENLY